MYAPRDVPVFYFHICDDGGFFEDEEGRDLDTAQAAVAEAVTGLRDLVAGGMKAGELNLACFIEIEDENHELLATVSVEDAVRITSERGESPRRAR